ncbi:MAG: flavodoxin-dependent (E)-4-hydroxy-3-methylbut-2-enyl-diphosphate synthase [Candidatus Omnitrophica bacterium]|jgi:(E)-4-hydroxy-3-methylbut-2-enyl-diphosphate synthase|nr:flavodoxin-dependent (E)-4-hydroxy-3-methylbut-2-enyl-diphosphate synthase [Candidatus Omnitrophota bacterium]
MIKRRKTRKIKVGSIYIGADAPISVQSMTKIPTSLQQPLIKQVSSLIKKGAEIIRIAILDKEDIKTIPILKKKFSIPLVADIHFDYRLAFYSIEAGIDKVRVNPGNIKRNNLKEILNMAKERKIPIRLGFNSGSIPLKNDLLGDLVSFAADIIHFCEDNNYFDLIISLKTPFVYATVEAYRNISKICNYPFHLGITEAGSGYIAVSKSVMGIGLLLNEGIGDTIRVSLTEKPEEEVEWTKSILQSLELRKFEPEIISCPTCGRCEVPLYNISKKFRNKIILFSKRYPSINNLKIALMGCSVNGPGEAKQADIGIAGGKKKFILFEKGLVIGTYNSENIEKEFFKRLEKYGKN